MASGDDLFREYDAALSSLLESVSRNISKVRSSDGISPSQSANMRARTLDAADIDLTECGEILDSMRLELASSSGNSRLSNNTLLERRKAELSQARSDLRAARLALAASRDSEDRTALLGSRAAAEEDDANVGSLLDGTRRLHEGTQRILESRKNVAETEAIGRGILEDLQSQRVTIMRARDGLADVESGLQSSEGIISSMNRRAMVNKFVIYAVLLFVLMSCFAVIYARIAPASTAPQTGKTP